MNLDDTINGMKAISDRLMQYSSYETQVQDEEILSCLKQRQIDIDGYELIVYYNKCDYEEMELECLQIYGKYFTTEPPARETVEVSRLPKDVNVEISCIAIR